MPPFTRNPLNSDPLHRTLHHYPLLFGIPFLVVIVGASFALQTFTQTRYDLHDQKVTQVNKETELGLKKNRKKFDIREEYFKLEAARDDNWEQKRVPRLPGMPEWGLPPPEPEPPAQSKSSDKA
ncbi:hypothetical protein WOLCODRAFT_113885 [Wolfiporia cocos MD-104 SS10]|uniref:Cytochrome c oxidase assembly protein COX16, mitochondrial n=1 Tax=Wolfiporia cocos (strain MD-104) TaxID=742152 RepID=A0A2H3J6T6_WOLCO|nr:hypothetical protein WOLCODRAFT_113885 [Wolfiporia cocos MD-104 SS10]